MEENLLKLIATDRIEIPFSSLEQKLRRDKVNIAKDISLGLSGTGYTGNRTFAYTAEEEKERARGMKEAINEFVHEFPFSMYDQFPGFMEQNKKGQYVLKNKRIQIPLLFSLKATK